MGGGSTRSVPSPPGPSYSAAMRRRFALHEIITGHTTVSPMASVWDVGYTGHCGRGDGVPATVALQFRIQSSATHRHHDAAYPVSQIATFTSNVTRLRPNRGSSGSTGLARGLRERFRGRLERTFERMILRRYIPLVARIWLAAPRLLSKRSSQRRQRWKPSRSCWFRLCAEPVAYQPSAGSVGCMGGLGSP